MSQRPLVLAITGASGAVYAVRLLQVLLAKGRTVHLTISPSGAAVIKQELGVDIQLSDQGCDLAGLLGSIPANWWGVEKAESGGEEHRLEAYATDRLEAYATHRLEAYTTDTLAAYATQVHYHHYQNYFTPIASGSYLTEAMVICPCSGSTLSGIVRSASSNLIERAAEVHLKERRPLVVMPRETPLSTFQIENMLRASQAGIVVLPAAPGWYHGVHNLGDLVDFVVARILDQLQIPHQLMHRWGE